MSEIHEVIYNPETGDWTPGEQIAYRGKKDCTNPTCTRRDFRSGDCWGWHCSLCHAPCGSQGHRCALPSRETDASKELDHG